MEKTNAGYMEMPSSHPNPAHINYENQRGNSGSNYRVQQNDTRNSLSNAGNAMMRSGVGQSNKAMSG